MALVLIVGVPLSIWGFWMRLGRTPAARTWATGRNPERQLFAYPFFGAGCVLAGVGTLVEDAAVLSGVLITAAIVALLISILFGLFGVPAPAFLKPRWYRELSRSRRPRRSQRQGKPTARAAATPPVTDPAWAHVRASIRDDVAALQPEDHIRLVADDRRFVEVWHYGDRISVDCAGSQAWGGSVAVSEEQHARLRGLGFTTPMERRRELETSSAYRVYLRTDDPAQAASRAADLAVAALDVLGVAPSDRLEHTL